MRAVIATCALCSAFALNDNTGTAPWSPIPPCPAPVPNPAVNESMCSQDIASLGGIVVRNYGLPVNETLVVARIHGGLFVDSLPTALVAIFDFFQGGNDERLDILSARTVPITVRLPTNNASNGAWTVAMMVSTAQYPDNFKIPTPLAGYACDLEPVGRHTFATLQFNTTAFPEQPDFEEACGAITAGPLPAGYSVVANSSWSPTWVIYDGEEAKFWTNECWVEVTK